MKIFKWDNAKNQKLLAERNLSFEMIVELMQTGFLIDDITHPNQEKYAHQRMFVVNVNQYACLVPYVETDSEVFLKTIIPIRRITKAYLGGKNG